MIAMTEFRKHSGITLIEAVVVVAMLLVVASLALPAGFNAAAKAELRTATESIQHSIDTARHVARLTESPVEMIVFENPESGAQSIRFYAPEDRSGFAADLPVYVVPESTRLLASHEAWVFDGRGLVQAPGTIILVSADDEDLKSTLTVF